MFTHNQILNKDLNTFRIITGGVYGKHGNLILLFDLCCIFLLWVFFFSLTHMSTEEKCWILSDVIVIDQRGAPVMQQSLTFFSPKIWLYRDLFESSTFSLAYYIAYLPPLRVGSSNRMGWIFVQSLHVLSECIFMANLCTTINVRSTLGRLYLLSAQSAALL